MAVVRRVSRGVLVAAVRGRRERGGPWGEAVLAEFEQTKGGWEAARWAAGGLRTAWRERRELSRRLPRTVSVQRRILTAASTGLVAAVLINQFALSMRYMPSEAMAPTVPVTSRFVIDKVSYRFTGIDRGDIVEFTIPDGGRSLKRVIGLPGDTISCRDGRVWRDGVPLDEPYLKGARTADCDAPVTVPNGHLYVLGDHREISRDSRQWGPIPAGSVDGRRLLNVW